MQCITLSDHHVKQKFQDNARKMKELLSNTV